MRRVILSLVIGALLGGLIVRLLSEGPPPATASLSGSSATEAAPPEAHHVVLAQPERIASNPAREASAPEPEVLITTALRTYAENGLRSGWKAVRKDEIPAEDLAEGMKSFEKLVLESAVG